VVATSAVEELGAAGPRPADDVLEIGDASGERADRGGACNPAPGGEEADDRDPGSDLGAAVRNVAMWDAAGELKREPNIAATIGERPAAPTVPPVAACNETITHVS
jgi:hypothetical protein